MMSLKAEWRGQRKKISEVEHRTVEISQSEQQNETSLKKLTEAHRPGQ